MANKDLNILIKAKLDTSDSQVSALNNQIKELQSKLGELSIKVNVDDNAIKQATDKIKKAQDDITKNSKDMKVFDYNTYKAQADMFVNNVGDVVKKAKDQYQQLNPNAIVTTTAFKDMNEELQSFIVKIAQANGEVRTLSFSAEQMAQVWSKSGNSSSMKWIATAITDADAMEQVMKRVQDQQDKLVANAEKLQRNNAVVPASLSEYISRASDKSGTITTPDQTAELQAELKLITELTTEMNNFQKSIDKVRATGITPDGLDQLEASVKGISSLDEVSGIEAQITAMKQEHEVLLQLEADYQKMADLADKAQRAKQVSDYKAQQQFEDQRAKVAQQIAVNLEPDTVGQDKYSYAIDSTLNAQSVQELNDAKQIYQDILNEQIEYNKMADLAIVAERQMNAELQKREAILAQQQAREANRVANLGEQMIVSPANKNVQINVPQNVFGNMNQAKAFVADVYGIDASMVSLKRSVTATGDEVLKWQVDMQTGRDTITRFTGTLDEATGGMYKFADTVRNMPNRGLDVFERMRQSVKNLISQSVTMPIFGAIQSSVSELGNNIIQLDSQYNVLKRSMQDTAPGTDFNAMIQSSINIASQYGAKIDEVNKIMANFAASGRFNSAQITELTKTATIASNITGMSGEQAGNTLHTIMNSFGLDVSQVSGVVDKMANVSRNAAVSSADIANAMAKAGAAAQTYGVDIDHLNGYIAAIGQVTRESGNVIGNSLKTIFSRLDSKTSVQALQDVGVEVQTVNGQVASAQDVIDQLAGKWNTLTNAQQQHIAVTVAGRYQLTRFLALMNDFQKAQQSMTDSQTALGSSQQEEEIYNQSAQASINKLSTAWMNLSNSSRGVIPVFKMLVDSISAIVDGLANMGSPTSIAIFGLTALAFGASALQKSFNSLRGSNNTLVISQKQLALQQVQTAQTNVLLANQQVVNATTAEELAAANEALTVATEELTVAETSLEVATSAVAFPFMAIGAIIGTLGIGLAGYIGATQGATQSSQEFLSQGLDDGNKSDQLNTLIDKYVQLKKSTDDSKQSNDLLNQTYNEILRLSPSVAQALSQQGSSLDDNAKKAKEYANSLKQMSEQQVQQAYLQNQADEQKLNTQITADQGTIDQNKGVQEAAQKHIQALTAKYKELGMPAGKEIGQYLQEEINKQIASGNVQNTLDHGVKTYLGQLRQDMQDLQDANNQITSDSVVGKAFSDQSQKQAQLDQDKANDKVMQDYLNHTNSAAEAQKNLTGNTNNSTQAMNANSSAVTGNTDAQNANADATGNATDQAMSQADALAQDVQGYEDAGTAADVYTGTLQSLANQYENNKKNVEDYNSVLSDLAQGKKLNADQVLDLIAKEGDFANAISIENGQITINKQAVEDLRDAKITASMRAMEANNTELTNTKNTVVAMLQAYGLQISGIENLAQAKQALADLDKTDYAGEGAMYASTVGDGSDYQTASDNQKAGMKAQLQQLVDFYQKMDDLTNMMKQGYTEAGLNGSGSGSGAANVVDALTQALDKLNAKIKEEQNLLNQYPKSSKQYRDALQAQIDLIKQKDDLMQKELNNPTVYTYGETSSKNSGNGDNYAVAYSQSGHVTYGSGNEVDDIMKRYGDDINSAASKYNLPPALIAAMIYQESSGNASAVSADGGKGLMQLTSSEYVHMADKMGGWDDPTANIQVGAYALRQKIDAEGGNLAKGLADYNGSDQYIYDVTKHMSKSDVELIFGNGSDSSSSSNANNSAKKVYDAQKNLKDQMATDAQTIKKLQMDMLNSVLAHYDEWQKDQDQLLATSQQNMKNYSVGSKQYIAEQANQIDILMTKQGRLHLQSDEIRNWEKQTGISTDEFRDKIRDLGTQWMQLQQQISQIRFDMVNAEMQTFTNTITRLDQQIQASKGRQSLLNTDISYGENYDNVTKANQEIVKQITLYKETANAIHEQTDAMRAQLATGELTVAQAGEIQQKIIANGKAWLDAENNAKSLEDELLKQQETLADQIVSIAKQRINDEKTAYGNATDAKMQADQDAYDAKMQQMDNEKKKQDDFFDAQKQALSRNNATADYNATLAQKEKDRQKIQDQLNNLSLDNSAEAIAKKKDLQDQLDQIDQDIAKTKRDRDVQVQSNAIDDAKKAYDDQIDAQKQADQNSFNQQKESDQKAKQAQDQAYQSQLDDEQHWAQLKKDVVDGNYKEIEDLLDSFQTYYDQHMQQLGKSTYDNFTYALQQAQQAMQALQNSVTGGAGGSGAGTAGGADQQGTDAANKGTVLTKGDGLTAGHFEINAQGTAIAGTQQLAQIAGLQQSDIKWDGTNVILQGHKFAPLANRNGRTLISVKDFASVFGMQLQFNNNNGGASQTIQLYHDGGIIGNRPTSKLTEIANRMFNANANEEVVKALKGELYIPPQNIAKNFIPNLGKLIADIGTSIVNTGDTNYHLSINIEKIGNKSDADYATKRIVDEVKKLGRTVRS